MQTVCIDATWDKEIVLGKEFLSYLTENNIKSVALFASVQFLEVDVPLKQLADAGIEVKTTKAKRTHVPMQILGCDAYHDSFEEDIIAQTDATVYIGDGMFHPKALLLAQMYGKEIKPVLIWNPVSEIMQIISVEDIKAQVQKTRANIMRYIAAKTIGILVTVKPGQQYLANAVKLKKKLQEQGKEAYIFIDDDVQLNLLENYPFVQAWVNTACPRIGMDDLTTVPQPLLNIREAYFPERALERIIQL